MVHLQGRDTEILHIFSTNAGFCLSTVSYFHCPNSTIKQQLYSNLFFLFSGLNHTTLCVCATFPETLPPGLGSTCHIAHVTRHLGAWTANASCVSTDIVIIVLQHGALNALSANIVPSFLSLRVKAQWWRNVQLWGDAPDDVRLLGIRLSLDSKRNQQERGGGVEVRMDEWMVWSHTFI